jgi:predicted aspartyl protease
MRKIILPAFLLFALACNAFTNPRLNELLEQGEYFRFRSAFLALMQLDTLDAPGSVLYYSAWEQHVFGSADSSNHCIALLVNGNFNCSDSIKARMLQLELQNDFRTGRYRAADSVCGVLLFRYPSVMAANELEDVKNFASITKGLRDVPPMTVERNGDLDIPYKRDMVNLIRIDVSVNGKSEKFIFDSGANISTITETQAKKMKLQLLDASFGVASSSKASVNSSLGLAKELKIGNTVFRNVIFIVMPDKQLKFAGGLYKIKGIIGIPVILLLGEIQVTKKGRLRSPLQQTESNLFNLGMAGMSPIADISFYGTSHPYIFDTGAASSVFNACFLPAYKDSLGETKESTSRVGGAGGIQEFKVLHCFNLRYSFGGKAGTLKRGMVQLNSVSPVYDSFYGIAGEDIFTQWETMTINFNRHFVRFD